MNFFQQNRCYLCHQTIPPIISWRAIFSAERDAYLCSECESKLEKIAGDTCRICCRPFYHLDEQFRHGDLCHDCLRWEEDPEWQGLLSKNTSLFLYNDFFKEVIATFKFRGDYIIAKVFAEQIKEELQNMNGDILVPIPLSGERLYERGFNQAEALLLEAGFTSTVPLTRVHSEKQSKKTRTERIHLPQVFTIDPQINILGKNIVLLDDVNTTGSTLRHAAKLLRTSGAACIQSLTLAR
ncbi:ComF family protein [Bacillus xiapuensis]|uniref:ComF family protein n=1 Tax=Bacillus xiapuensis TaxID=2014075 RepID=A0ABU6N5X5_9BACI|nr:ComF family protein [Bacillus xiapuensis]